MNRVLPFGLAAAVLLIINAPASAQQRGGTGGGGMSMGGMSSGFGSGMSGFGGMSGMSGMGGFGGGGMGGFGGGMGMGSGMGMGMSSGSGMGGFGSGMGGMSGMGQSGMNGMQNGQQGFIGRDSNDMTNVFRQMGRSSNQFFQQLNRTLGRGGGGRNRRNSSQEENATLPVRVRLDVAFNGPQIQPTMAATKVRARLTSALAPRNITAPEVDMAGDTVVLRGVAQSESQRMVIEQLVLLEPGVFAVDNQMTVAADPAADQAAAPAPSK